MQSENRDLDDYDVSGYCGHTLQYSGATAQGRKRPSQQDRLSIGKEFILDIGGHLYRFSGFAVFDGHGGDGCASFLDETFFPTWTRQCQEIQKQYGGFKSASGIHAILMETFHEVNEAFTAAYPKDVSGSTASVVIVAECERHVARDAFSPSHASCECHTWVAVLGDSSVVRITPDGQVFQVGVDHKAYHEGELMRMSLYDDYGGISRSYAMAKDHSAGLAVTRSFGDVRLSFVTARPDIYYLAPGEWSRVIVCSDGVWDVMGGADVAGFVDAPALLEYRQREYRQHDNVTILFLSKHGDGDPCHELPPPLSTEVPQSEFAAL